MINKKVFFRIILVLISSCSFAIQSYAQDTRDYTINVKGRQDWSVYTGGEFLYWDEFTIVNATGISWLRIIKGSVIGAVWETSSSILYDGVPIPGLTVKCVKRPPPCEGCAWEGITTLALVALGEGSVTIRLKKLWPNPPFPVEGDYLDKYDGTFASMYGSIIANPGSVQPGNSTNIQVTIPNKMRRLINGVVLILPGPPNSSQNRVTLPFELDGVYNFAWNIPVDAYYDGFNVPTNLEIRFEAYSNNLNANGQSYLVTSGTCNLNIASVLGVEMILQDKIVPGGSSVNWDNNRSRSVSVNIIKGQGPFKVRWIVNSQEVKTPPEQVPQSRGRTLADQNVLGNAATITAEVTDANGNQASGTIYVGVETDISFQINVQGIKVENGSTVNWRDESSKLVTINPIFKGKTPFKSRWFINGVESASKNLVNRFDQFDNQEALNKAKTISIELTDANGISVMGTINIGNPGNNQGPVTPTGPVGPAPIPPSLSGNPNKEPNPDINWNNKPWLDARVQACTREYLQKIVLYMENEIRKWENSGLVESKQNALFTSIDDWGRLLNQYMTTSGGVDGNWDNPTHYVWSVFNKPSATIRYGRTVEYYVKYECNSLQTSTDDINTAIKELTVDGENNKWDNKKTQNAVDNLNRLLDLERTIYRQFNVNYNKFVNEINDRNSNPLQNEIVALCLASAQNQLSSHSINKDTIDASGSALIAQSATNKDVDMMGILRILSEVQVQSDDIIKKLAEMKNLLAVRGGDIENIIANGERLIGQNKVNPEFAQDGGVNVEFFGDGIDNFGDGLQDYLLGNQRRGNVLIVVWDGGNIADDIFEVSITGKGSLGTTPPGGRRNFDIVLSPGTYTVNVRGVYTNPNSPPCTYGIQIYDGNNLILQTNNNIEVNQVTSYTIVIK